MPGYFQRLSEGPGLSGVNLLFQVGYLAGKTVQVLKVRHVLGKKLGMVVIAAADRFEHALYVPDLALEELSVTVWHVEASQQVVGDTHFSILSEIKLSGMSQIWHN